MKNPNCHSHWWVVRILPPLFAFTQLVHFYSKIMLRWSEIIRFFLWFRAAFENWKCFFKFFEDIVWKKFREESRCRWVDGWLLWRTRLTCKETIGRLADQISTDLVRQSTLSFRQSTFFFNISADCCGSSALFSLINFFAGFVNTIVLPASQPSSQLPVAYVEFDDA